MQSRAMNDIFLLFKAMNLKCDGSSFVPFKNMIAIQDSIIFYMPDKL